MKPPHPLTVEQTWHEMVSAAITGTGRRPFTLPALEGEAGKLLNSLGEDTQTNVANGEIELLASAAVLSLLRKAGLQPQTQPLPLPTACKPEDLPRCSPAASRRLQALLDGQFPDVLPEWLQAAAKAGLRAPENLLPALLDLGSSRPELRAQILPVLGERGAWLAALRASATRDSNWEYAGPLDPQAAWQTGRREIRLFALEGLRSSNPAAGRQLLASTWGQETAADRARFLAALRQGLSLDDGLFLEAALDDRSKEVRRAAVDLLSRLDGSNYVARMARRAQSCLAYLPGRWPVRKAALEVTLPEALDEGMQRDGVSLNPRRGVGERAGWLLQILSAVPPASWTRGWRLSPVELLELAGQSEWREALLEGWLAAAIHHRDGDWAEALLDLDHTRVELLEALTVQGREAYFARALETWKQEDIFRLVAAWKYPLGPASTRAFLKYFKRHSPAFNKTFFGWSYYQPLVKCGLYMDPDLYAEAARSLSGPAAAGTDWRQAAQRLLDLLEFRYGLHKALQQYDHQI